MAASATPQPAAVPPATEMIPLENDGEEVEVQLNPNGDVETGGGGVWITKRTESKRPYATSAATPAVVPPVLAVDDPVTGKGFLKPLLETTAGERLAGVIGTAAVATALVAMIVEQSILVAIGGVLSCLVGPYCYYQQTRLTDIRTLSETRDALTRNVEFLAHENQRLAGLVDDMSASVDRLHQIDEALTVISDSHGHSVAALARQVDDNKRLLQQMRTNVQANVLQNLLSVILRSDMDRNARIGPDEIDDLFRRLSNMKGVKLIHEDRFRRAVQGKPVAAVMDIVKNLLRRSRNNGDDDDDDDVLSDDEQIFVLE